MSGYTSLRVIDGKEYLIAVPYYRLDSKGKGTPNIMSYKCPICRVHSTPAQFNIANIGEELNSKGIYKCPFCENKIILPGKINNDEG
jgi:DNA-directed RNA polymerase subunit RPC12/RpoP